MGLSRRRGDAPEPPLVSDTQLEAIRNAVMPAIPPAPVALIDSYLARLNGRHSVSASEVRDLLLDVRNALWRP